MSQIEARGLGAVACYDPYFSRATETIKRSLADGHPVLVRLHAGAAYPTLVDRMLQNDLEGHAVLIVGYDDDKNAFAILDPWQRSWGGDRSGAWWISYSRLQIEIADGTRDYMMIASPLVVTANLIRINGQSRIDVRVGFYVPAGIVMDQENQALRHVTVEIENSVEIRLKGSATASESGDWHVGDRACVSFPLCSEEEVSGALNLLVRAKVTGERPYYFEDEIVVRTSCLIAGRRRGEKESHDLPLSSYRLSGV